MNNKELDEFLSQHMSDISKFAKMHCKNYDYYEFRSELLYDVYKYMEANYDPEIQDNLESFFYSIIGFLAQSVYRKMVQESVRSAKNKKKLLDILPQQDGQEGRSIGLDEIIRNKLTPKEQAIVYSIDYFCSFDKFKYKSVALKLGIPPRSLQYYIKTIRKKIKSAIESNKTS
jgi:RNA polymerase sigma factor (sigma-70 family)